MTVPSIKIAITNSEGYEEEFVKNLYETIIANGKRLEELERAEKIILEEFKLSPEVFRQKFVQHQKKSDSTWKDFTFEITNYLDEWLIGLEINTFQDLKDLMVVDQLKKLAYASMKDHFLDNWANLKSATQIAELFDNYEDVRKVNSKPMDRWGRNDKILTNSGVKEKENRFGKTSPRLGASVPESTRERTFEKRVIQRCYHCNMPGHIKAVCPKLIKNKTTETLNNIEENENPDFLNSYTTKGSVNGHKIDILRDTGATIDLVCAKYINPSYFSGENVWVKQPLSPELFCLPLAVVEISGNFGTVQTKAAVCGNHLNQHGRYLLGNKMAELIKGNLGYNFLPVEILNAVQTRSQVKAAREERGIDSGDAKKREDEVIIVSSDAEDEILIPALQEFVPELALLRVTRENLINAQKNSEEIKSVYEQAASQVPVTNHVYSLEKELLVKNHEDKLGKVVKLIVVPEGLSDPIKSLCHEGTSAHLGITKSKDKLNRYFYWPNCYRDMKQFVKTCNKCQRAGKPNDKKKVPLKLVPVIQEVFTKLNIDACGSLPITSKGNRYLITAICMSSKFPEAIPVSDISSVSVTDALLNIFGRMGFPREIQCDQGTSFTSALTTEFFERFGILVRHSSVYHPQSNPVERFHRTLKRLLRVLCLDSSSEWDKHLPSILLALRTVSHESTGYTPSELVYGKNLRTPETLVMEHWMEPKEEGDLVTEYMFKLINRLKRCQEVAINKMEEMQVERKTWCDKNAVKREFKDGDLALVLATSRANKLALQWIGPGTILNKISETNYLVEIPGRRETSQILVHGFRTSSEIKVQAVLEFPTPRTKTQIRAFLGLAGYYQKYINLFSVIAAPLTDALKGRAKKGEITWTTECENAFRELKGKLIDKPVLYALNFEREFIVQTDASNTEVEKRYCTTEKECASIVFAIKRLHYYLDGNSFLVMTDHNPLVWLNRNVSSNPRLMRWALALQP
ncbi:retrovirus-related Pol polyprotein from transposon 297 [Trichonephila clavipes]|uniref:RNA-directed DNA polymerase n=1 Tax=Trichonephila clavipes TaxID=2585209 RepID=A0A8X6WCW6_TRICX|nr:retrovirus-related Pol polyprotein from transposon 297 [Trichonephila clavipes]